MPSPSQVAAVLMISLAFFAVALVAIGTMAFLEEILRFFRSRNCDDSKPGG